MGAALDMYLGTTDENCYDGEADLNHYINPRMLLLVALIAQGICICPQCYGALKTCDESKKKANMKRKAQFTSQNKEIVEKRSAEMMYELGNLGQKVQGVADVNVTIVTV